jgi:uncharacterized protein (TIGR02271 family)
MAKNGTIAGYFPSWKSAESTIKALEKANFNRNQVGCAILSGTGEGTLHDTRSTGEHKTAGHEPGTWNKIKDFFGAGPVEAYESEAAGDSYDHEVTPGYYSHEDFHHSLTGLDVPEEQVRYFRSRFGRDAEGAVVTVRAQGREAEVEQILRQHGADLGESTGAAVADAPRVNAATAGIPLGNTSRADTSRTGYRESDAPGVQNIRLYGEVLRVHTDRINRGEVRVRKEVHTTNQTVDVPTRREELVIERTPVQGERPAGNPSFQEQEIRVPLSEDRVRVEKQPVVREEVKVGKKQVSDVEKVNEQVRNEDLKVENDVPQRRKTA